MTIDEAIKVAEAALVAPWNSSEATRFECKFNPPTVLALLRFVQAWDKTAAVPMHEESWNRLCKARATVDEALKQS